MNNPKVSVCITTYNHEKYIAQAIESVLMQNTNFEFEILIGEDESSDSTRSIVKAYKKRHPEKIRLFLNYRKNVIYINNRPTGRFNLIKNLTNAKGQYIALLDGDDYWTDRNKLQKQVEILDRNPDISLCFSNLDILENNHKQSFYEDNPTHRLSKKIPNKITTLEDICQGNFIHTSTVVYRNQIATFPDFFYKVGYGDWTLFCLIAQHGNLLFIEDYTSVYRSHDGGIFSSADKIFPLIMAIDTCFELNKHFNHRLNKIIIPEIHKRIILIKKLCIKERQLSFFILKKTIFYFLYFFFYKLNNF